MVYVIHDIMCVTNVRVFCVCAIVHVEYTKCIEYVHTSREREGEGEGKGEREREREREGGREGGGREGGREGERERERERGCSTN